MRRNHLSQRKQNKLIELFVAGVIARTATEISECQHKARLLITSTVCTCLIYQKQLPFENV